MELAGSKSEFEIGTATGEKKSDGRARVIYDKDTMEILEIDPLRDDTADS